MQILVCIYIEDLYLVLPLIDFWSTTCPNCPPAVSTVQSHAIQHQKKFRDVHFVTLNTDDPTKAWEMVQNKKWNMPQQNLHHYHVRNSDKEVLKSFLAMSRLPHHVMLDHVSC